MNLDFSLSTESQRRDYVIKTIKSNPTNAELELYANYILWGNKQNAKNYGIETKNKTWDKKVESLDSILESSSTDSRLTTAYKPQLKTPKLKFSRKDALSKAPPHFIPILETLFKEIDTTELLINFWELENGKRSKPPRDSLKNRFTELEQGNLLLRARNLSEYQYLKLRHRLVEMRREQYTIRDMYAPAIQHSGTNHTVEPSVPIFGDDISVKPSGLIGHLAATQNLVQTPHIRPKFVPPAADPSFEFDFANENHLYHLVHQLGDLQESVLQSTDPENTTAAFLETWERYKTEAPLNEIQREVLELKTQHLKNEEIAARINEKFGTTYNPNYVSTIFRKKALHSIATYADLSGRILEALGNKTKFKKCSKCGEWFFRDATFFTRRARSKDGLSGRCKQCEKKTKGSTI